jgi:hypothetical protein
MPANKSRQLLQHVLSEDETMEFKYYSTGSVIARFMDAPPTKSGADTAFARINNVVSPEAVELLPKLFKLLEEVAHRSMAVTVEYQDRLYFPLFKAMLEDESMPALLRWAAFAGAITDSRELTPEDMAALARECEPRLEQAVAGNAYRFFFRPDLGYFSQRVRTKVTGIEELKKRRAEIAAAIEAPIYKLAQERIDSGVITANAVNLRKQGAQYQGYNHLLYGASMILTEEEITHLSSIISSNKIHNHHFEDDASMLMGYTYLKLGPARAEELVQFYVTHTPKDEFSWMTFVRLSTLEHPTGLINFENMSDVIDSLEGDDDTPLEWAVTLGI